MFANPATKRIVLRLPKRGGGRCYSITPRADMAWWNPFSRGGTRDPDARVASAKSTTADATENPRRIQERKDATLAILATEFRRLSREHPKLDREKVVDMAFESIEEKDLDGKTLLQLRYELHNCLKNQAMELFQHLAKR